MFARYLVAAAVAFGLAGCKDDPDVSYDGTYAVSVTHTVSNGSDGRACADYSGEVTLSNSVASGSVADDFGYTYEIRGTFGAWSRIEGDALYDGSAVASFRGPIDQVIDWIDSYSCTGDMTLRRITR